MELIVQTGGERRISAGRSWWASGLVSLAEHRSGRFAGRARLERRSSGGPNLARNQSRNSVLFASPCNGARGLRCCRLWRFAREGHRRIRSSVDPVLGVRRGMLLASLEDVMNSRRGAAVTLGNSGYRLALCIPCRNGAPIALRNFGHVYSCFVRGLFASFTGPRYRPRGTAEFFGFAVANAAGPHIGVPKGAVSEIVISLTISRSDRVCTIRCLVSFVHCKSRSSTRPRCFWNTDLTTLPG